MLIVLLFFVLDEFHVVKGDASRLRVDGIAHLIIYKARIADGDVVYAVYSLYATGLDSSMGAATGHATDVDVLELGSQPTLFLRQCGNGFRIAAGRTVDIVTLEHNRLVLDICHLDVGYV